MVSTSISFNEISNGSLKYLIGKSFSNSWKNCILEPLCKFQIKTTSWAFQGSIKRGQEKCFHEILNKFREKRL